MLTIVFYVEKQSFNIPDGEYFTLQLMTPGNPIGQWSYTRKVLQAGLVEEQETTEYPPGADNFRKMIIDLIRGEQTVLAFATYQLIPEIQSHIEYWPDHVRFDVSKTNKVIPLP